LGCIFVGWQPTQKYRRLNRAHSLSSDSFCSVRCEATWPVSLRLVPSIRTAGDNRILLMAQMSFISPNTLSPVECITLQISGRARWRRLEDKRFALRPRIRKSSLTSACGPLVSMRSLLRSLKHGRSDLRKSRHDEHDDQTILDRSRREGHRDDCERQKRD